MRNERALMAAHQTPRQSKASNLTRAQNYLHLHGWVRASHSERVTIRCRLAKNAAVLATMYVVLNAVVPRLVMPVTIVLTIVITFLVTLSIAPVMDNLMVVYYATR
jgi:hypothetical protein